VVGLNVQGSQRWGTMGGRWGGGQRQWSAFSLVKFAPCFMYVAKKAPHAGSVEILQPPSNQPPQRVRQVGMRQRHVFVRAEGSGVVFARWKGGRVGSAGLPRQSGKTGEGNVRLW